MSAPDDSESANGRWRRAEALYHEMLARPVHERASALAAACANDPALAADVQSLLDQPDSASGYFASPPLDVAARLVSPAGSTLVGRRIGVFEVQGLLGAGGMGEVYRARDSRLQRTVAIKILPRGFTRDPERLARFEREARVLASLSHPNIGTLYDVQEADGLHALVLEFVEGETLGERISGSEPNAQGVGLPLPEALSIARQIAEALEAAHEKGIVHRDLKPANIMITPSGAVKVLDFGLAKLGAGESGPEVSASPTATRGGTRGGVILGTAAYMSPEQARGRPVDKRTDIWAFGCVLYEMLTGRRLFGAEDVSETLAAVLTRDVGIASLPEDIPSRLRVLLRDCLVRDSKQRLRDIGDARIVLDKIISGASDDLVGPMTSSEAIIPRTRERIAWLAALVVLGATLVTFSRLGYMGGGSAQTSMAVTRSLISVAPADQLGPGGPLLEGRPSRTAMALSPDGRSLVFSAVHDGELQLYLRPLDGLQAAPIADTEGADSPFFSPDGKWIGFWAQGALKKVAASGGAATTICETRAIFGASWGTDDAIVYAGPDGGGLWLVPAGGGVPRPLTTLDPKAGEYSHRLPQFLPDGRAVVFTTVNNTFPDWRDARLSVVSIATGERKDLGPGADARYAESGHLVFVRSGTLVAAPLDLKTNTIGNTLTMLDGVMQAANMVGSDIDTGAGQFSLSASGSLAYLPGGVFPDREATIVSVDRRGSARVLPGLPLRPYFSPRLSPDQSHLVMWTQGVDRNVWTYDIARGTLMRLTTVGRNSRAIWTPDGKRIAFSGSAAGFESLFWMPADGSGAPERLTATSRKGHQPSSWSHDGRTLAFIEFDPALPPTVMTLSLDGNRQPKSVLSGKYLQAYPEFSWDGRYLAYVSDESGRAEVYVQPYPGPGARTRISNDGGTAPAWSRDGRELFFSTTAAGNLRMMVVPIQTAPSFSAGTPQMLFEGRYGSQANIRGYDVSADGQHFFFTQYKERSPVRATEMILVQNWFEELKAKAPSGR